MGTNSLSSLVDELETVIQPISNKSVKCTHTTSKKRVFDENYLIQRLCQPIGRWKRLCDHNSARKNYKNVIKPAKHLNYDSNNTAQNSEINNETTKHSKIQSHNKETKLICNETSNNSDTSNKIENESNTGLNIEAEPHILQTENQIQKEGRTILSYKPEEKCECREEHLSKEKQFPEYNLRKKRLNVHRSESTSELQSIENDREHFSQELNSQVKQLTNYWNSLLKEQNDTESSEYETGSFESFRNLSNKHSIYRDELCFRNDNLVNSGDVSDMTPCGSPSSAVISNISIDLSVSINGMICQLAMTPFTENEITLSHDTLQNMTENNSFPSNELCLRFTANDGSQILLERKFALRKTENLSNVEKIDLEKVKQALQILNLCKEHLWRQFIAKQDFFTANKLPKNTFPLICEEVNTISCQSDNNYNVDQDIFENQDLTFWYQNIQFLLNIPTVIKSCITSVFDQINLYGPTIERFAIVTYNFFVSLLILKIMLLDTIKI